MRENFASILDHTYAARDIPRLLAEATAAAIDLTNAAVEPGHLPRAVSSDPGGHHDAIETTWPPLPGLLRTWR